MHFTDVRTSKTMFAQPHSTSDYVCFISIFFLLTCILVESCYTLPPNLPQLSSERELAKETHTSLSNTLASVRTTHELEKKDMEEEKRNNMAELSHAR